MIAVDTSVVVRYLVGTPAEQAGRAMALMEADQEIGLPLVALVETAHVLRAVYGVERGAVVTTLIDLLTRENIRLIGLSSTDALAALASARTLADGPIADALIAGQAQSAGALPVYSFDKDFHRMGVQVRQP
ncbi:MAG: PIN domain-containing protein [Chloroflexota bacterium]